MAFQTLEILNGMQLDSKLELKALLVDGGMTNNDLLMQTQADFLGKCTWYKLWIRGIEIVFLNLGNIYHFKCIVFALATPSIFLRVIIQPCSEAVQLYLSN